MANDKVDPIAHSARRLEIAHDMVGLADADLGEARHLEGADYNMIEEVRQEVAAARAGVIAAMKLVNDLRRKGWGK